MPNVFWRIADDGRKSTAGISHPKKTLLPRPSAFFGINLAVEVSRQPQEWPHFGRPSSGRLRWSGTSFLHLLRIRSVIACLLRQRKVHLHSSSVPHMYTCLALFLPRKKYSQETILRLKLVEHFNL